MKNRWIGARGFDRLETRLLGVKLWRALRHRDLRQRIDAHRQDMTALVARVLRRLPCGLTRRRPIRTRPEPRAADPREAAFAPALGAFTSQPHANLSQSGAARVKLATWRRVGRAALTMNRHACWALGHGGRTQRDRSRCAVVARWRLGADRALFYLQELVWRALVIGSPVLLGTLVVGLLISVLQVATQIQEIALRYVPKLLTAAVLLMVLGGWMLGELTQFAISVYQTIPNLNE